MKVAKRYYSLCNAWFLFACDISSALIIASHYRRCAFRTHYMPVVTENPKRIHFKIFRFRLYMESWTFCSWCVLIKGNMSLQETFYGQDLHLQLVPFYFELLCPLLYRELNTTTTFRYIILFSEASSFSVTSIKIHVVNFAFQF